MSGHSKWATIHRQKGIKDQARGKLFSKLARAISIAVKTGGGPSPDSNLKLRVAIDKARENSMPKENIERAISKAEAAENVEEIFYEGFGPLGTFVIIDAATDNRNRTGQEIKNILERSGGGLGGPGSASFNFEPKGFILVKKKEEEDHDLQLLSLIDAGADDVVEEEGNFDVYVAPHSLFESKKKIEEMGFVVGQTELIQKPKNIKLVKDVDEAKKLSSFLENIEEHDDVQKVFINADIAPEIMSQI